MRGTYSSTGGMPHGTHDTSLGTRGTLDGTSGIYRGACGIFRGTRGICRLQDGQPGHDEIGNAAI